MQSLVLKYLSSNATVIQTSWLSRPSPDIAPELIGCWLVRQWPTGETIRSLIVEAEAYTSGDPACHAYRRRTPRNSVMFGPAGKAYVYLIYGMYHCFNVVTDDDGIPSAVLLRAVELERVPEGVETSKKNPRDRLGAGPGKLCRVLDITLAHTQQPLIPSAGLWLEHRSPECQQDIESGLLSITQTTRIGLTQGTDIPWRWYLENSPAVSKRAVKKM
ncbi:MAG: DNA-3-methyladenine glycosylase [Leptolyngbyaceae bacterium]|nr:DNA-3-methyladenine glycosylase [Leptolyngbyaceae bacterium]